MYEISVIKNMPVNNIDFTETYVTIIGVIITVLVLIYFMKRKWN